MGRRRRAEGGSRFIAGSPEPRRRVQRGEVEYREMDPSAPHWMHIPGGGCYCGLDEWVTEGWEHIRDGVEYDEYAVSAWGTFGRMTPAPPAPPPLTESESP